MTIREFRANKIASVAAHLDVDLEVEVSDECVAANGNVVLVRALEEKRVYDQLELVGGRMAKISRGDLIVGALGSRRALKGFVGSVPRSLHVGDTLHVLNLGGVIGLSQSAERMDIGRPLAVECLGMVVRDGRILNVADKALESHDDIPEDLPLVMISGTCMNSGKTKAACELIQQLTQSGMTVSCAKVSGVACLRDIYRMIDHGAVGGRTFLDCGLPSTVDVPDLNRVTRTILHQLHEEHPEADAIVVELGDGIIGEYGLGSIYNDKQLMARSRAHIMCANDLVAAWGAVSVMSAYGLSIDIMSGPATDNEIGTRYIEGTLKLFAANAAIDAERLADRVKKLLKDPAHQESV